MSDVSEPIPDANADDSAQACRRSPKWTTDQNLVLLSEWIKYGTDSIVGRNQKSKAYWSKISEIVMSISHLILPVMELHAEIISTM